MFIPAGSGTHQQVVASYSCGVAGTLQGAVWAVENVKGRRVKHFCSVGTYTTAVYAQHEGQARMTLSRRGRVLNEGAPCCILSPAQDFS